MDAGRTERRETALDLGPDVRVLLLLLRHRRSQEITDLGVPFEARQTERRVAFRKRMDIGTAFNQEQHHVSMTARGGLMQGRVSEISMLIDVDAGFDQEPRSLDIIPSGSQMQRVLIVTVRCVYIIEQVSIKNVPLRFRRVNNATSSGRIGIILCCVSCSHG
jgi:hypothetical protein